MYIRPDRNFSGEASQPLPDHVDLVALALQLRTQLKQAKVSHDRGGHDCCWC